MKKKRFTLPLALVLAGTIALGAGCGSAGGEQKAPVVTVQDGYVYVDGVKTDIQVNILQLLPTFLALMLLVLVELI